MHNKIENLGKAGIIVEDWDIRNSYPYKTFTTDYSTWTSYISRKPVPANTPITDTKYWKPVLKPTDISVRLWLEGLVAWTKDIENKVDTFLKSVGGTAISTQFGDSNDVGISQKTITNSINKIWDKLDEMTGETHRAINMIVSPDIFVEDECHITMAASADEIASGFDYIEFLINGEAFEGNNATSVTTFVCNTTITDECYVTCNARILGVMHTMTKHVYRNNVFYIGGGTTYNDVLNPQHMVHLDGLKGNYDINFNQNDYLFIILPTKYESTFIRADLNGFELSMNKSIVTVNGIDYSVFKSSNSYSAGTYNFDINS